MCSGARSSVCGSSRELDGAWSGARAPYCRGWLDGIIAYGPDLYAARPYLEFCFVWLEFWPTRESGCWKTMVFR